MPKRHLVFDFNETLIDLGPLDPVFADLFDHVLCVDAARCYKPHPNAYAVASGTLGCRSDELRLIACHDRDVTGAMRAGMAGAFVARGRKTLNAASKTPDIIGIDLIEVAARIMDVDR